MNLWRLNRIQRDILGVSQRDFALKMEKERQGTIQSLIDRIIRWFARPRYGADNKAVLNQLVVRLGLSF